MVNRIRAALTYANVVSTLCLFLLLGGGAYAATQIPRHSVGTRQLKNHAVTPRKISKSAKKSLRGKRGLTGPRGTRGAAGPGAVSLFKAGAKPDDDPNTDAAPPFHALAKAGPWSVGYRCRSHDELSDVPSTELVVEGPAGEFRASLIHSTNDYVATAKPATSGGATYSSFENVVAGIQAGHPDYDRESGTVLVNTPAGRILTIDFSIVTDFRNASPTCSVYGSAFATG